MTALPARLRRCVAAVRAMEADATPGPLEFFGGSIVDDTCCAEWIANGKWGNRSIDARLIVAARNTLLSTCGAMEAMARVISKWLSQHGGNDCTRSERDMIAAATAWCEAVEREYGVAEQRESEEAR